MIRSYTDTQKYTVSADFVISARDARDAKHEAQLLSWRNGIEILSMRLAPNVMIEQRTGQNHIRSWNVEVEGYVMEREPDEVQPEEVEPTGEQQDVEIRKE